MNAQDPPQARSALRDGNVLRWLTGYTLSTVGEGVYFLTLSWAALELGGPEQVGLVMAIAAVPRVVLMLAGGVVADRVGLRKVVVGSDALRFIVLLSLALGLALARPGLWVLIIAALIFGVVDAIFLPAVGALPPRIAASSQLARIQGMRALALRLGGIAGGPLAGTVMAWGGIAAAFAVAAGIFAMSLVFLSTLRIGPVPEHPDGNHPDENHPGPDATHSSVWHDLKEGLVYLRRHPVLGRLVTVISLAQLSGIASLNIGLVLLSDARGWGSGGLGWLIGAYSVGAGLSAVLIIVRGRLPRAGLVQSCALIVAASGLGCLPLVPSLPWAAALACLSGAAAGVHGGLAQGLVQTLVSSSYLGRVTSVITLASLGLAPLTYPLFSVVALTWGMSTAFLSFGAVGVAGALLALASRRIRSVELH